MPDRFDDAQNMRNFDIGDSDITDDRMHIKIEASFPVAELGPALLMFGKEQPRDLPHGLQLSDGGRLLASRSQPVVDRVYSSNKLAPRLVSAFARLFERDGVSRAETHFALAAMALKNEDPLSRAVFADVQSEPAAVAMPARPRLVGD